MPTRKRGVGAGLLGVITRRIGDTDLRLTLRSITTGRALAVVDGSEDYLLRALAAVGLTPPLVTGLSKVRDGSGLALVGSKPRGIASKGLG